ncbi:MAG TPA: hypothetical protein VHW72_09520 [Candidatus Angelobacter sp.]|nr:hypothetical protein [Candidatus Angelobacter sp.]
MPDSLTAKPPATTENNGASSGSQVNVFAVHGVESGLYNYGARHYGPSQNPQLPKPENKNPTPEKKKDSSS